MSDSGDFYVGVAAVVVAHAVNDKRVAEGRPSDPVLSHAAFYILLLPLLVPILIGAAICVYAVLSGSVEY